MWIRFDNCHPCFIFGSCLLTTNHQYISLTYYQNPYQIDCLCETFDNCHPCFINECLGFACYQPSYNKVHNLKDFQTDCLCEYIWQFCHPCFIFGICLLTTTTQQSAPTSRLYNYIFLPASLPVLKSSHGKTFFPQIIQHLPVSTLHLQLQDPTTPHHLGGHINLS